LIENGGFEEGFAVDSGVGNGWGHFSGGNVEASFYDDAWEAVVIEGEHAQLIELINASVMDTYAGIYQNVEVEADQAYQLSFKGIVRSSEGSIEASNYGYRMQYAIDLSGNEDWEAVETWVELPWDEEPRTSPASVTGFVINSEETTFTAAGDSVTIFFRAWKKWPGPGEGNYNLDAIRLVTTEADEITEPLPETGQINNDPGRMGALVLGVSIILILVLIAGAVINQKRHRA
jgi:hypothetical protein